MLLDLEAGPNEFRDLSADPSLLAGALNQRVGAPPPTVWQRRLAPAGKNDASATFLNKAFPAEPRAPAGSGRLRQAQDGK
jgi:hypothetical protein